MKTPPPLYKVKEIFYSLQGEGAYSGCAAVFVRLAGCSMRCSFCDTDFRGGALQGIKEIIDNISVYPSRIIVLTGGEPAEQNIPPLIKELAANGCLVHIETNGSIDFDVTGAAHVCVSPKREVSEEMLKKADALKLLVDVNGSAGELERYFKYQNSKTQIYLQPLDNTKENTDLCVLLIKKYPFLRLSLQTHKMIGIR